MALHPAPGPGGPWVLGALRSPWHPSAPDPLARLGVLGVHLHWAVEEISGPGAEFVGVRCIRILPRLLMVGDDLLPLSPLSLLFKDNRGPSWLPFHIPNTCGNGVSGCANDRFLLSDVISAVFDDMHTYSTTILR